MTHAWLAITHLDDEVAKARCRKKGKRVTLSRRAGLVRSLLGVSNRD